MHLLIGPSEPREPAPEAPCTPPSPGSVWSLLPQRPSALSVTTTSTWSSRSASTETRVRCEMNEAFPLAWAPVPSSPALSMKYPRMRISPLRRIFWTSANVLLVNPPRATSATTSHSFFTLCPPSFCLRSLCAKAQVFSFSVSRGHPASMTGLPYHHDTKKRLEADLNLSPSST